MMKRRDFLKSIVAGGLLLSGAKGTSFADNIPHSGTKDNSASAIPSGFPELDSNALNSLAIGG